MEPESFGIYFKLKNGPFLLKVIALIIALAGFGLYKIYDTGFIDNGQLIAMIVSLVLALDAFFFLFFMLPYLAYKKQLATISPLSAAWKDFISCRSKEFLAGRRYVGVVVSVDLADGAAENERGSIEQFLKRWEGEGQSLHIGKSKTGASWNFNRSDFAIGGDVAIGSGMNLLLQKIFTDLPGIIRSSRADLKVTLRFGAEKNFE